MGKKKKKKPKNQTAAEQLEIAQSKSKEAENKSAPHFGPPPTHPSINSIPNFALLKCVKRGYFSDLYTYTDIPDWDDIGMG